MVLLSGVRHPRLPLKNSNSRKENDMMYFMDIHENAIPLFSDTDILPVTFMYYKSVASLMHDINNNNSPPNLSNLF